MHHYSKLSNQNINKNNYKDQDLNERRDHQIMQNEGHQCTEWRQNMHNHKSFMLAYIT